MKYPTPMQHFQSIGRGARTVPPVKVVIVGWDVARGPDMNVSVVLDPDGCFRAIDLDNYDVDCDHTGFFSNSPVGYGRTPLDAIICLLDEVEAQNNGK